MKRYLLLIGLFLLSTTTIFGQGERSGGQDRIVLELNWNGWLDAPDGIEQQWYSRGLNLFFMYDLPFGNSPFSIAPGFGLGTDNVYHNGVFTATDSVTLFSPIADSINLTGTKLNTTYLEVPLELRFRTKPNDKGRSWKIAAGIRGGLLITSHVKYRGEGTTFGLLQDDVKYKLHDIPRLDNLRYGATFRVGYGPINLQAYYGLSTLFEAGQGPDMAPLHIGISFNGL